MQEITSIPDFELDLSYLEEIANGNTEFIVEMIDLFLQQAPEILGQIHDKIAKKEWNAAGSLAHKLKPTFAMIGIHKGKDLSEKIEKNARGGIDLGGLAQLVSELDTLSKITMGKLMSRKLELVNKI
jgi:HPt (histidine-containing phosphotransfer) domain-containing protein